MRIRYFAIWPPWPWWGFDTSSTNKPGRNRQPIATSPRFLRVRSAPAARPAWWRDTGWEADQDAGPAGQGCARGGASAQHQAGETTGAMEPTEPQWTIWRLDLEQAYEHPVAIGWSRYLAEASTLLPTRAVATSVATQALIPGPTGRHQMKSVPHLCSRKSPGWVLLEGFGPTRNRKVVGSNPTSGSKTAGQRA